MIILTEFSSNDTFSELILFPPKKPVKDKQLLVLRNQIRNDVNCHLTKVIKSNLITLSK